LDLCGEHFKACRLELAAISFNTQIEVVKLRDSSDIAKKL
jgi:hypothetical protein